MSKKLDLEDKASLCYTGAVIVVLVPAITVVWPLSPLLGFCMVVVAAFSALSFLVGLFVDFDEE